MFRQIEIFEAGKGGYHTYRIPALAVSCEGTLLAFCEGRKYGRGDAGKINLLLRRSFDGGLTWAPTQLIVAEGDKTCGNPCPVVDQRDGTIWLPFCKNPGEGHQGLIMQGKASRTVWITRSMDDGASPFCLASSTLGVRPRRCSVLIIFLSMVFMSLSLLRVDSLPDRQILQSTDNGCSQCNRVVSG